MGSILYTVIYMIFLDKQNYKDGVQSSGIKVLEVTLKGSPRELFLLMKLICMLIVMVVTKICVRFQLWSYTLKQSTLL